MSDGNASVPVDLEFPVTFRVILVASACVASTLGNVVVLLIFWVSMRGKETNNNRCRVIDIIIASLASAALLRGLALGPVRAACFIKGGWPLGDSMCQLQAYFEAMLRNAILWYLSLLSIERYTKHMVPHEYLVTFSPLTVNIILPGMLLIVIVQVTGPLYGWGKYEYIQDIGLCGAATPSTFGCSYSLYLFFSLMLPPFLVILVNSVLLSSMACEKTAKEDKKSFPTCGESRVLTAENEVPSIVALMVLFLLLSVPRCVVDVTAVCSTPTTHRLARMDSAGLSPNAIFAVYFLESLTDLLLPFMCLGMHPSSRKMLREAIRRKYEDHRREKTVSSSE